MGRAQFPRKRAVLERAKKRVEGGEGGLVGGFGAVDRFDAVCELPLEIDGWEWKHNLLNAEECQLPDSHLPDVCADLALRMLAL